MLLSYSNTQKEHQSADIGSSSCNINVTFTFMYTNRLEIPRAPYCQSTISTKDYKHKVLCVLTPLHVFLEGNPCTFDLVWLPTTVSQIFLVSPSPSMPGGFHLDYSETIKVVDSSYYSPQLKTDCFTFTKSDKKKNCLLILVFGTDQYWSITSCQIILCSGILWFQLCIYFFLFLHYLFLISV